MKSILISGAVFATVALANAQQCPIPQQDFDSYDFSNSLDTCGDLRSVEGCDSCFAGLVYPMRESLEYVPTDTSFEQFGQDVSDLLQNCQSEFTSAVQGDLGFRAASLLGLRNCELDFAKYQKTTQVVIDYFNSIGRDISAITPGNGGASSGDPIVLSP